VVPARAGPTKIASWLGGDIDDAFDQLRIPAWIIDRRGVIQWANAKSIEIFGDFRGHPFMDVVAPEALDQVRVEIAKKLLGTARTSHYETVFRRPSGERVPVEIHSVGIRGHGMRVVGIFGFAEVEDRPVPRPLLRELTPRQREVLLALARGSSTAQIADSLGITRETVRNHIRGLLRTLQVHSRLEAVVEARARGLIS
jgi:PAS domain S-box-containing protein